ncbi:hypothetical protein [Streptomyces sp. NPDC091215]|uniref:hypothetical protein n=1 Tax=Streptomyces sp. NPDC091215 TaxID=3155192 RepID=UPI003425C325
MRPFPLLRTAAAGNNRADEPEDRRGRQSARRPSSDPGKVPRTAKGAFLSYVDTVEVAAQRGACYLDMGMTEEATGALTEALARLGTNAPNRARDRVHYMSRLAKCHLLDGEVEQACQVRRDALALSQTIGSVRITERLGELNDALSPFGRLP